MISLVLNSIVSFYHSIKVSTIYNVKQCLVFLLEVVLDMGKF